MATFRRGQWVTVDGKLGIHVRHVVGGSEVHLVDPKTGDTTKELPVVAHSKIQVVTDVSLLPESRRPVGVLKS